MAKGDTRKILLQNKDEENLIPYTELATASSAGRVKPDGTTTSVDSNGTITVIGKQDTLVSGTNIKTVNGNSLLGSGDVTIATQTTWGNVGGTLPNQTDLQNALDAKANNSDVVKLTGNQTIEGNKTFTGTTTFQQSSVTQYYKATGYTKGTAPTSDTYLVYREYRDSENRGVIDEYFYIPRTTNTPKYILRFRDCSSASSTTYKDAFTAQFDGTNCFYRINDGVVTYAPTPTEDTNSSHQIDTVGARNTKLSNYALNSDVVKLTGDQTIGGEKTFTDVVIKQLSSNNSSSFYGDTYKVTDTNLDTTTNPAYSKNYYNAVRDKNNYYLTFITSRYGPDGSSSISLTARTRNTNNSDNVQNELSVGVSRDGSVWATAPTPASSDNSTKIATTAFVKNVLEDILLPPGTILSYGGTTAPTGFLICDGSAISRTTYADLFAVIGTAYGTGDESTTFNLPNFTNRWLGGNGTGYIEAGLPNITGSINGWESNTSTYSHSGAFKLNKTVSGGEKNGNGVYVHTDFNASWCSTIYGNSTTVQPATCKTYFIIKY